MSGIIPEISPRKSALISGIGLLAMTVIAIIAQFVLSVDLVVPWNAEATVANISANLMQLRIVIVAWALVIVLDWLVAWGLYIFLSPVNRHISLLAAWARLMYTAVFAAALFHYFHVLQLLEGIGPILSLDGGQINAQVMLHMTAFQDTWASAYLFFGLHLLLVGYLALKSDFVAKIPGIILVIGGIGYIIDTLGKFLFADLMPDLALITGWGELVFMVWLLIRGGRVKK